VQQQLLASSRGEPIEIGPYLSRLCDALAASIADDSRPVSLKVLAKGGTTSSAEAVSIGLIVTELVINAFKHAFVGERTAGVLVVTLTNLTAAIAPPCEQVSRYIRVPLWVSSIFSVQLSRCGGSFSVAIAHHTKALPR
jgi:hypothetical protein